MTVHTQQEPLLLIHISFMVLQLKGIRPWSHTKSYSKNVTLCVLANHQLQVKSCSLRGNNNGALYKRAM